MQEAIKTVLEATCRNKISSIESKATVSATHTHATARMAWALSQVPASGSNMSKGWPEVSVDLAGDILELSTSKSSSRLFPVPLVVPFVDWNGSNGDPPAAEGVSHGSSFCCCDVGVPHGSLDGSKANGRVNT